MKIVIPSFQRHNSHTTINQLKENNIDLSQVYLFLANEKEKELYLENVPKEVNIIIGLEGIGNQRNFIDDYFEEGEILVSMDDDIQKFIIREKSLQKVLDDSIEYLTKSKYNLLGFPPLDNEFYYKNSKGYKEGLYFIIGAFYIYKIDKSLKLSVDNMEDYERTLNSFEKYGKVIRCNDILFKTKYFGKGGMEVYRKQIGYGNYYNTAINIQFKFPQYVNNKLKKIKYFDFKVPNISLRNKKEYTFPKVIELPEIDPKIFEPLLKMLETHKLRNVKAYTKGINGHYRKNFPQHNAEVFGIIRNREGLITAKNIKMLDISNSTKRKPFIWEELKKIGDIICPFKYSSCYVNNNTISGKHLDSNNVGLSTIVSIGDYEGCNLTIEGKKYDAKYKPLIFDGSKLEHWNTDDLVGNKYSLIFYNCVRDGEII